MTGDLPLAIPSGQRAALEAAYASPSRAYHNFGHVRAVLRHYTEIADGPGWMQPAEVYLAVLYHDAIYEAGRSDNEARSAGLAVEHIARWLPDAGIDAARVAALIELTARHARFAPEDFDTDPVAEDARHFLDCDMAILGADAAGFDAYDRGIAAEYRGRMPAWLFRRNRRRFLKALLARKRIFLSDFFHARLDAQARSNLRRAVAGKHDLWLIPLTSRRDARPNRMPPTAAARAAHVACTTSMRTRCNATRPNWRRGGRDKADPMPPATDR